MANESLIIVSDPQGASGTTNYSVIAGKGNSLNTTEARADLPIRNAGTIKNLYVRVLTNSTTSTLNFTFRTATTDSGVTTSIGASTVGVIEDTSHTKAVTAGDLCCTKVSSSATVSFTTGVISYQYDSTTDTTTICNTNNDGASSIATTNAIRYFVLHGVANVNQSTENNIKFRIRKSFTGKSGAVYVSSNSRTTNTVFNLRKNGANGTVTVTFGNVETGLKEDTSNSDSLSAGDDYNWQYTNGAGAGTLNFYSSKVELINTSGYHHLITGHTTPITQATNLTRYYYPGGAPTVQTTEANAKMKARFAYVISELNMLVTANTNGGTSTMTLRKSGAAGNNTVSIGASATGLFNDTTHSDTLATSDDINYQLITSTSSGTMTIAWFSCVALNVTTTQVNQSFTHLYKLAKLATQSFTHNYKIVGRVAQTYTHKYKLRSLVNQLFTHKYKLRQLAAQVFTHKYKLIGRVASTFTHKYKLIGRAAQTFTHLYKIRQLATQTYTQRYKIKQLASSTYTHKYKIVGRVAQQFTHRYRLLILASQSFTHKYKIIGRVAQLYTQRYKIIGRAVNTFTHKYKLRQLASQTFTHKYKIHGLVTQTFTHIYKILSEQLRATASFTHKYKIIGRTNQIYTHKYNIANLASQSFTHRYKLRNLATNVFTHRYKIRQLATQAFHHRYRLLILATKTYTFKYNIIGRIAQQYIHRYKLRQLSGQKSFTHIYKLRQLASQTFTHKYKLRQLASQVYTFKYNIIGRVSQTFTHIYNILVLVSAVSQTFTFKYRIIGRASQTFTHRYNVAKAFDLIPLWKQSTVRKIESGFNAFQQRMRFLDSDLSLRRLGAKTRKYLIRSRKAG